MSNKTSSNRERTEKTSKTSEIKQKHTINTDRFIRSQFTKMKKKIADHRSRRPHRSFKVTAKRDYKRSFKLPGYIAFTLATLRVLKQHWLSFLLLGCVYVVIVLLLGAATNQDMYNSLVDQLTKTTGDISEDSLGELGKSLLLSASLFVSAGSNITNDSQQILFGFTSLLIWMATVWLLREYLAGKKPRLRDALYSSSAPLVATFLVVLYGLMQAIPVVLLMMAYAVLSGAELLTEGFGLMLFSFIGILVVSLVLYWLVSTFIALIIVTLPGMYPMHALRVAGDLVVGRRLRILLRLVWMIILMFIFWLLTVVPIILLDSWMRGKWEWIQNIPLVPAVSLLFAAAALIWSCVYIYLLYRKLVEDDAAPA